jgi:hypothetical protein
METVIVKGPSKRKKFVEIPVNTVLLTTPLASGARDTFKSCTEGAPVALARVKSAVQGPVDCSLPWKLIPFIVCGKAFPVEEIPKRKTTINFAGIFFNILEDLRFNELVGFERIQFLLQGC